MMITQAAAPVGQYGVPQVRPGPLGSPHVALSDVILARAFETLPAAIAMTVTERPSGTLVYLLLDNAEAEEAAYDRFAEARQRLGMFTFQLLCILESQAAGIDVAETARIYRFR